MIGEKPDVAYFGTRDADGVRFVARGLAIFELIQKGDIREPTEAEIQAKIGAASAHIGVGLA